MPETTVKELLGWAAAFGSALLFMFGAGRVWNNINRDVKQVDARVDDVEEEGKESRRLDEKAHEQINSRQDETNTQLQAGALQMAEMAYQHGLLKQTVEGLTTAVNSLRVGFGEVKKHLSSHHDRQIENEKYMREQLEELLNRKRARENDLG